MVFLVNYHNRLDLRGYLLFSKNRTHLCLPKILLNKKKYFIVTFNLIKVEVKIENPYLNELVNYLFLLEFLELHQLIPVDHYF